MMMMTTIHISWRRTAQAFLIISSSRPKPYATALLLERSYSSTETNNKRNLLWKSLEELDIDAKELDAAAITSLEDPTLGYDGRYGKSAIRTYRSFVFSKQHQDISSTAAAGRCARQIQFLLNRHKSHQAEFVRHHDASTQTERTTFPLVLLLDNVRSAFNVGSIFRTADACGVSLVLTVGITPHPGGSGQEKLHKSALGAELLVPSRHFATTRQAMEFIRNEKSEYQIVGMETTERSQVYSEYRYPVNGVVLVLGNEVTGVGKNEKNER